MHESDRVREKAIALMETASRLSAFALSVLRDEPHVRIGVPTLQCSQQNTQSAVDELISALRDHSEQVQRQIIMDDMRADAESDLRGQEWEANASEQELAEAAGIGDS